MQNSGINKQWLPAIAGMTKVSCICKWFTIGNEILQQAAFRCLLKNGVTNFIELFGDLRLDVFQILYKLARYIIRASFSQDGSKTKMFDALEWLATMCFHLQNKGEQMVRY